MMHPAGFGATSVATGRPQPLAPGRSTAFTREDLGEFLARLAVGTLFLTFTLSMAFDFQESGRITGLLVVASEGLVVIMTVVRRRAIAVDRSLAARLATTLSLCGPLLLRPTGGPGSMDDVYTAALSACGLSIIVVAKMSLGRSFGLMPANRGIVCSGLYRVIRHPIYAGYLLTHAAYLAAQPSLTNAVVLLAGDSALMVRAIFEERTLSQDPSYMAYRSRVRWRVLPGVF